MGFNFPISGMFWGPFVAFVAVLALIPLTRILALRIGLVDQPDERKMHEGAIPLIGGLVIFPVFMVVLVLSGVEIAHYLPLFFALTVLLIMGAVDDLVHLPAGVKFFIQIGVAVFIVVIGDARLYQLGNLFGFGDLGLGIMAIPFSIAAVALLINAINLMDGLDGLAAGKSFIVLGWLSLACAISGEWGVFQSMGPLMGALLGFLFYNMRHPFRDKACIFLGDAGSLGLGLVIAWFCIGLAQEPDPVVLPISIAWIVALPVMDACGQFYRRIREKRHPFSADRGHFHHHFIHAGIPVGRSTALILLLGVVLGGIGYGGILIGVPQVALTILWVMLILSHMALSQKPDETYIKFFSHFGKK